MQTSKGVGFENWLIGFLLWAIIGGSLINKFAIEEIRDFRFLLFESWLEFVFFVQFDDCVFFFRHTYILWGDNHFLLCLRKSGLRSFDLILSGLGCLRRSATLLGGLADMRFK